jgi:hypothetical protein
MKIDDRPYWSTKVTEPDSNGCSFRLSFFDGSVIKRPSKIKTPEFGLTTGIKAFALLQGKRPEVKKFCISTCVYPGCVAHFAWSSSRRTPGLLAESWNKSSAETRPHFSDKAKLVKRLAQMPKRKHVATNKPKGRPRSDGKPCQTTQRWGEVKIGEPQSRLGIELQQIW